jgi:outer membrane autotransporter protein
MKQHTDTRSANAATPSTMQRRHTAVRPGQLSCLTLALAAALAAPQAGAVVSASSGNTTYTWDVSSDPDLLVGSGITITSTGNAIETSGSSGTLTNAGVISGDVGIRNTSDSITLINNTIGGSIAGNSAVDNGGSIGTISNHGTITGNYTGVFNYGSIGTISNNGLISGVSYGIYNNDGGTINVLTIGSGGVISASSQTALVNRSHIGTLSNAGTISGTIGIDNLTGTIDTLINSGTISGSRAGIYNGVTGSFSGAIVITSLDNSGLISGTIGLNNNSTIVTLSNSGTISGSQTGLYNGAGGSFSGVGVINSLSNSGLISGGNLGLANSGTIVALSNSGTIIGSSGLSNSNVIGSLNNSGLISAQNIALNNSGNITALSNSGTILSTGSNTSGALNNGGSIGTLSNSGVISSSSFDGVHNYVYGTITSFTNSGTISGANNAISNEGSITSLTNSGTISGGGGLFNTGTIDVLNNSGLITGSIYAVGNVMNGTLSAINNSGTIAGLILNSSTLTGLNINGGSGSIFGTLTGLNGSIGSIVSAADVVFSGGSQLLNDNISVGTTIVSSTGPVFSTNGIGTVTNAGGVLQLNNHITITGNYQQNTAATLAIGVGDSAVSNGVVADTGYGRLIVTGNAVVASGSGITLKKLNSYSFATGQRFVVIQASGSGTNYNASTLNYRVAGYTASGTQVYDGSYYDLVVTLADAVTGSTSVVNAATASSALPSLNGLFRYSGTNATMVNFYNAAVAASGASDSANLVGAKLSPTATRAAAGNGVTASASTVQSAAGDRIDGVRGGGGGGGSGISSGEASLSPALWGRAFGGRANQGERDGISGYHASYGGVIIGGDALATPDWRLGGLFNYARTNVGNDGDNSGSSASVNSYGLMAYAGFDGKPWYVNLTAGVARQQYSTTRNVSFTNFSGIANGSYNGTLVTASAQAGYPLELANLTLTPLAGLNYSTLRQNGYTENGGNGAALTVNGSTANSLKSQLGVKLERSFATSYGLLQPAAQLGWNHEFKDSRLSNTASFAGDSSGATSFTTLGATPLRNTAQLSLGATLLKSNNLSLSARYTVEAASGYTAQTGDVTVRWQY